jgi:hypothetical protein
VEKSAIFDDSSSLKGEREPSNKYFTEDMRALSDTIAALGGQQGWSTPKGPKLTFKLPPPGFVFDTMPCGLTTSSTEPTGYSRVNLPQQQQEPKTACCGFFVLRALTAFVSGGDDVSSGTDTVGAFPTHWTWSAADIPAYRIRLLLVFADTIAAAATGVVDENFDDTKMFLSAGSQLLSWE